MKSRRVVAAGLFCLPIASWGACVQTPESPTETAKEQGSALADEVQRVPSDVQCSAGDPTGKAQQGKTEPGNVQCSANEPTGEAQQAFSRLALCLMLSLDPGLVKAAFCKSQPEPDVRARCWSKILLGPVAWVNWCHNEFPD